MWLFYSDFMSKYKLLAPYCCVISDRIRLRSDCVEVNSTVMQIRISIQKSSCVVYSYRSYYCSSCDCALCSRPGCILWCISRLFDSPLSIGMVSLMALRIQTSKIDPFLPLLLSSASSTQPRGISIFHQMKWEFKSHAYLNHWAVVTNDCGFLILKTRWYT